MEEIEKKTKLCQKVRLNYKPSMHLPTQALGENQRISSETHDLNRHVSKKQWH